MIDKQKPSAKQKKSLMVELLAAKIKHRKRDKRQKRHDRFVIFKEAIKSKSVGRLYMRPWWRKPDNG